MAIYYIPSESGWQGSIYVALRARIEQTYDAEANSSTLTVTLQGRLPTTRQFAGTFYFIADGSMGGTFKCNGTTLADFTSQSSSNRYTIYVNTDNAWRNVQYNGSDVSWTVHINHNTNGSASVPFVLDTRLVMAGYDYRGDFDDANATLSLQNNPAYKLTVNPGSGSSITVKRNNTALSNGATIYRNDVLTITCTPNTNYRVLTLTVNGSNFTSGSTHTVVGDVLVASTAQPLSSSVAATDANIGSTSIINITRYNSTYKHTLTYSFSSKSGTITTKTSDTTVSWTVPTSFYAEIPDSKTGTCTITCQTYNSSGSLLGSSTCSITVTASESSCKPTLSVSVVDVDAATTSLTGDNSKLIKYRSDAKCSISASAKNSATISRKTINGVSVSGTEKTFQNCENTSFVFSAVDSRGYKAEETVTPTIINYIPLTLTAEIKRVGVNSSNLYLFAEGKFYNGSFGSYSNTLTIKYRYSQNKTSGWSDWETVPVSGYATKAGSYATTTPYEIIGNFDYKTQYYFEVMATDGANGTVLTTATTAMIVKAALPIFDWGENDFRFNVHVYAPWVHVNNTISNLEAGDDMNDYVNVGKYGVSNNSIAASLSNCPSTRAGVLTVWNATGGDATSPTTWYYVAQEYCDYYGYVWRRNGETGAGTVVTWGAWKEFG